MILLFFSLTDSLNKRNAMTKTSMIYNTVTWWIYSLIMDVPRRPRNWLFTSLISKPLSWILLPFYCYAEYESGNVKDIHTWTIQQMQFMHFCRFAKSPKMSLCTFLIWKALKRNNLKIRECIQNFLTFINSFTNYSRIKGKVARFYSKKETSMNNKSCGLLSLFSTSSCSINQIFANKCGLWNRCSKRISV